VVGINAETVKRVLALSPPPMTLIGQWSIGMFLRAENVAVQELLVFGGAYVDTICPVIVSSKPPTTTASPVVGRTVTFSSHAKCPCCCNTSGFIGS
jgi:hypothetical protein